MEKETQRPDFWSDHEKASQVSQQISELKEGMETVELLKKELLHVTELKEIAESDEALLQEFTAAYEDLAKKVQKEETKVFLSGKYDKNNAIVEIFSGAGGQDSQDWATMLLRMYLRYCDRKGFKANILHQSFGDAGGPDGRIGTKSVTLEIVGKYSYGFLKKETGVHRLVRISPFSAKKLRHTSFAVVNVLPEIGEKDAEIEIRPEDIKLDTFRSSGAGGQYVNKTESAVRITHVPTGLVVASQTERSQMQNRDNAMKILYAKLHQLQKSEHKKELQEIKGDLISASWGNQIRSYVLHPYKMVKDLRTQFETSNTDDVLDGNLEDFIAAELKMHDSI